MRVKPQWLIYLTVVVATVGTAFYQYKQSQKSSVLKEKQGRILPSLESKEVQSISLKLKDNHIKIRRKAGAWFVDSPVQDVADSDSVEEWLADLLSEQVKVIKEKEVDFSEYGLMDAQTHSISLTSKANKEFKIKVSYYSAFDGQFYIKKEEALLLGEVSWGSIVDKNLGHFRSHKLLNRRDHPESFEYKSNKFSADLKWANYLWNWRDKNRFPLSGNALESYWSTLSKVELDTQILPDTKAMRKKLGLLTPEIEIKMSFKNSEKWSAKISSKINKEFYLLLSNRNYIFILNEQQRNRLLLTKKKIRDHRHAFQFETDLAHALTLKGYGLDLDFKKEKKKWSFVRGQLLKTKGESQVSAEKIKKDSLDEDDLNLDEDDLNLDEVANVLNRIKVLESQAYIKKTLQPVAHLEIKDNKGNQLLKLEFSSVFESKDKEKLVHARSSKGKEIMLLKFRDLKFVFSKDLLIEKKPANSP